MENLPIIRQSQENDGSNNVIVIPRMQIHEFAPKISEETRQKLVDQYKKFWILRYSKKESEESTGNSIDKNKVEKGYLYHNLEYNPETFKSILRAGVMSGEIGDGIKKTHTEDNETHFCADFFINEEERNVEDLVNYVHERVVRPGTSFIQPRTESKRNFPNKRNTGMSILIDGNDPALKELMYLSGTEVDNENIKEFIRGFPQKGRPIHRAVVVGIPANFISKIILGDRISNNSEVLEEIKNSIHEAGLHITLFDTEGKIV
jgi:hypothetical protein